MKTSPFSTPWFIVFSFLGVCGVFYACEHLAPYSVTGDSVKPAFFWDTSKTPLLWYYGHFFGPDSLVPGVGDYAVFKLPELAQCPRNRHFVIKKVVCTEGDFLRSEADGFFCNDRFIGGQPHLKKVPSECGDKEAPVFRFSGLIPEGKAFVLGDHPDSYDGRYFGFVALNTMNKALTVWDRY